MMTQLRTANTVPATARKIYGALFAWVVCLALTGCFGSVAEVRHHHYVLDGVVRAPDSTDTKAPLLGNEDTPFRSLWVRDFQINAVYDRAQLVRRLSAHEVEFVRDEVWAARLGRMLADAVARSLIGDPLFASVKRISGDASELYTLTGEVLVLEVDRTQDVECAHLSWVLQLYETRTGKLVGQQIFDEMMALSSPTGNNSAEAEAFNKLLAQAAHQARTVVAQSIVHQTASDSMKLGNGSL